MSCDPNGRVGEAADDSVDQQLGRCRVRPVRAVVISMRYQSGWAWDQAKSTSLTSGRSFRDACYPFALAILPTRGLVHGADS